MATRTKKAVKEEPAAKKPASKKAATAKKEVSKADPGKMALKTTAKKASAMPAKAAKVCIDYPANNETVYCGHYCFRLGSLNPVEWMKVSVNGGPWLDCRPANGYWWFDWWNFETGNFVAEALALIDGKEVKTAKRKFKVTL